jgi:uncharacterized protein (TIGR03435 family)
MMAQTGFIFAGRILVLLLLARSALSAQSPAPAPPPQQPIRVEVASIRPHLSAGDEPSNRRVLPGGRFVATATTLRTLIRVALMTDDSRISGEPAWVDQSFDITATTADHAEITTPQQFQEFLLSLLENRFQFKFHREQIEGPVYRLELDKPGKLGSDLKPSPPGSKPDMSTNSNGSRASMKVSSVSMADIAATLTRQAGRPVEDHTGIPGKFSFQIEWASQQGPESTLPSLFTVLKEQLGLKLQPAKGTIERIVVDQINRPSAN